MVSQPMTYLNVVTELKVGIFVRSAMVDQARQGVCY